MIRILFIEDSPDDVELMLLALRRADLVVYAERVDTIEDFRLVVTAKPWDAILSDYNLVSFDAKALLKISKSIAPDMPFIVVSGTVGEESAVEMLQAGAQDFILKTSMIRLASSIQRALREAENRSARRQAEEQALQLAAVVSSSVDAILTVDSNGHILSWNNSAEKMFGYSSAEMIGNSSYLLAPPELIPEIRLRSESIFRGDEIPPFESVRIRKNGVSFPVSVTSFAVRIHDRIVAECRFFRDITERIQSQEALRLRDRAIQAATQGLLISDVTLPDNPVVFASPAFSKITGYSVDEVLGRNCRFLQGNETDPAAVARVRNAVLSSIDCKEELINYRKDGSSFWIELSISPIRDAQGKTTHFVGVQSDITARKKLEQQLNQSQKMEAIGQLAGGVAHDFNNLLTIIIGYSDMLLSKMPENDPSRELLKEIHAAGERSAGLTSQLLAFSRQQVLSPKVLIINEVVINLEKMLKRLIGEDVELSKNLQVGLWAIRIDKGQFEQVLMNLVVNARDAMPSGGSLVIRTQNVELNQEQLVDYAEASEGEFVKLSVSDSGTGMSDEIKRKIFEPFFTTKAPGKGTGLGLATVYGIVKQSGSFLNVISEIGKGTTFEIFFPRVDENISSISSKSPSKLVPGKETILIVEDEDSVRALTKRILMNYGYSVVEAANSPQVDQILARKQFSIDLLITDIVMPGMGGRAIFERVIKVFPNLPVIYVSGYNDDAVIRHGVQREEVDFLQKPFTPSTLGSKVREVLDRKRVSGW
ncbi:PAS domain S-box protein [Telmatocola sphagniphila]|uniref:histidine kinase n=1 Tax=Telmatocola sphagniphila TaxID=1123043 RepID=A0A8E6EZV0_9BACT|nr:PAS domain S-box protein [Telmatocola sphagniphila]QVL33851.1 PAS domain S-box protein [Telmatocola sphagniphila]